MTDDHHQDQQLILTRSALKKAIDAIALVESSLSNLAPYDEEKIYSPSELEPYDALSSRFTRAVEVSIKFFRSYERLEYRENSETLRDLLNRMEKLEFIRAVLTWMQMRDVRNRIVHEYLPEAVKEIYDDIMGAFGVELKITKQTIENLKLLS